MKKYKIYLLAFIIIISASCSAKISHENNYVKEPPEWSFNKTIYEVNIRQYTEEGTFSAFEKHLPKLRDMGVGIVWLMPIHPIGKEKRKGTLGSYYAVKDYKGINSNFGSAKDFKSLVTKAHELGMYVIIDWVANHTAWDHSWTKTNKDFYTLDSLGNFVLPDKGWTDVIDLNYNNKEMWSFMIEALKYWVEEFDIDGYRCDVAAMVPREFWYKARFELDKVKPVFMLAEAHEPDFHKSGFDMTYAWQLKNKMNQFANGAADINDIKNHFLIDEKIYPNNAFRMNFTTNHDENSWNGTVYDRLGKMVEPFSVLISTAKGMPLVYSGQEAGMNKALDFFEKDLIEWKDHKIKEIYTLIFNEKKSNKALWNGSKGGEMSFVTVSDNENVLSFYREKGDDKVIVIINLSDQESKISFSDENLFGGYDDLLDNRRLVIDGKTEFNLNAYDFLVLAN